MSSYLTNMMSHYSAGVKGRLVVVTATPGGTYYVFGDGQAARVYFDGTTGPVNLCDDLILGQPIVYRPVGARDTERRYGGSIEQIRVYAEPLDELLVVVPYGLAKVVTRLLREVMPDLPVPVAVIPAHY